MIKYIPFLKTKPNEVLSIKEMDTSIVKILTPLFDIPRKSDMTEEDFKKGFQAFKKRMNTHLSEIPYFYMDNFDIDDALTINGMHNYRYILDEAKDLPMVPVISIDRSPEHILSISEALDNKNISNDLIAIRLVSEDFEMFELVEDEIDDYIGDILNKFNNIDLILDCRVCSGTNNSILESNIVDFSIKFNDKYPVNNIIISGSSINTPVSTMVQTESNVTITRHELEIFRNIYPQLQDDFNVIFADYGVVSPNYSDVNLPPQMLRRVMTPRIIYSYDSSHYIIRGGALATHVRGDDQYFDLAEIITLKPFYRGSTYSFGDDFIFEKSKSRGNKVTASSILKPTINAHIIYMLNSI